MCFCDGSIRLQETLARRRRISHPPPIVEVKLETPRPEKHYLDEIAEGSTQLRNYWGALSEAFAFVADPYAPSIVPLFCHGFLSESVRTLAPGC